MFQIKLNEDFLLALLIAACQTLFGTIILFCMLLYIHHGTQYQLEPIVKQYPIQICMAFAASSAVCTLLLKKSK